ncbi:MAG: flagellar hook basal-body protein [Fimbriimonadaceae bacterium]|nr:flagellar hook basal-body protein [Fimbriimonadaceae bacterium]
MRTRSEALDLISNNISNSATQGFKVDWEAYTLYRTRESGEVDEAEGALAIAVPEIESNRTDFSQGQLVLTNSDSDLALDGSGFFQVRGVEETLLTRQGKLQVSESGRLVNGDGMEFVVEETSGTPAKRGIPLQVNTDGVVTQDGITVGRLSIVNPTNPRGLKRRDGVYFAITHEMAKKLEPSSARVQQRATEAVNASIADSAAKLISVLRQFEALQKALQIGGDLGRKAVEEVARVAP